MIATLSDNGAPDTPIKATLVGVFRALRPPLSPGDMVAENKPVGQIEAMRLMNDCYAPLSGTVRAVLVEDGQPVEYGQVLFQIASNSDVSATDTNVEMRTERRADASRGQGR
jgi:acetyl-CoA carboxylase biotin carboxyl carrier protein